MGVVASAAIAALPLVDDLERSPHRHVRSHSKRQSTRARPSAAKGLSTYDIRKILGFFAPPPVCIQPLTCIINLPNLPYYTYICFWGTASPS